MVGIIYIDYISLGSIVGRKLYITSKRHQSKITIALDVDSTDTMKYQAKMQPKDRVPREATYQFCGKQLEYYH